MNLASLSACAAAISLNLLAQLPPPTEIKFGREVFYVSETASVAQISVGYFTHGFGPDACITYRTTANGSATPDVDFTPVQGRICFTGMSGSQEKVFTIPIFKDDLPEEEETIEIVIESENPQATIAKPTVLLKIIDPAAGTASFANTEFFAAERDGKALVTLLRKGGSTGMLPVRIQYLFPALEGDAAPNIDYSPQPDSITFSDGQTTAVMEIPLLKDNSIEGAERISLQLYDEVNGSFLGSTTLATVFVQDIALNITSSAQSIVLTWPDADPSLHVETSTVISPGSWQSISEAPRHESGRMILEQPITGDLQFFRLTGN
jgi:hypothetical protein